MKNDILLQEQQAEIPMQIIIQAGDARLYVKQALDDMAQNDFTAAAAKLEQAQQCISAAHKLQTDRIQSEARGESYPLTLLFIHAQDTLMTIFSELNLAKSLLGIFRNMDERIRALSTPEQERL